MSVALVAVATLAGAMSVVVGAARLVSWWRQERHLDRLEQQRRGP